jgi:hypothetical protein
MTGADDTAALGTCLLCHTVQDGMTQLGLDSGGCWKCSRCGQMWDAVRLVAATAYARTRARERTAATS